MVYCMHVCIHEGFITKVSMQWCAHACMANLNYCNHDEHGSHNDYTTAQKDLVQKRRSHY